MPTGKTKKYRKHTRTSSRRKTKLKKQKTRKRKQMKGGTEPIKNIFYIWLGETTKCELTEESLKSWRDGFPRAIITILVMKDEITKFNNRFKFLAKYNIIISSPIDFLHQIQDKEPVKKTIALLEKYIPFLIEGERSLFNESYTNVSGIINPDVFNSVKRNNKYFNEVHDHFKNTSVKIEVRFKDLLCFICCIYMPNTLYLDIDTLFKDFHPEKISK